jgi:hypothetical protein
MEVRADHHQLCHPNTLCQFEDTRTGRSAPAGSKTGIANASNGNGTACKKHDSTGLQVSSGPEGSLCNNGGKDIGNAVTHKSQAN